MHRRIRTVLSKVVRMDVIIQKQVMTVTPIDDDDIQPVILTKEMLVRLSKESDAGRDS
jgi:hypothetical protein